MVIGKRWAGRLYGTNTGDLYVTFEGDDNALRGRIHLNDPVFGLAVYAIEGTSNGLGLTLRGKPEKPTERVEFGILEAKALLNSRGELEGEWKTSIGSAGTFVLFPLDRISEPDEERGVRQEQLHSVRHNFGAVAVDREQITALAEEVQGDFKQTKVVVTVQGRTSYHIQDFRSGTTNKWNRPHCRH